MSRIPPPKSLLARPVAKKQSEPSGLSVSSRPASNLSGFPSVSKAGLKRQAEPQVALAEKKQKLNEDPHGKKNLNSGNRPSSKVASFSDKAKRAVLQPIPESALARGSMPAISVSGKPFSKAKRPAWDLKGRMADMEEQLQTEQFQRMTYEQRIQALEAANSMLHKDVESKSTLSEEATSKSSMLEQQLRVKNEEFETSVRQRDSTIAKLTEELSTLQAAHDNLTETYRLETSSLKSSINTLTFAKSGLQAQLDSVELLSENQQKEIQKLLRLSQEQHQEIEGLKQKVSDYEIKLRDNETTRRKLHNTIQELKGNIRVFCRMRPPLPDELQKGLELAEISRLDQKVLEVYQADSGTANNKPKKRMEFSFDLVFPQSASQREVFEEISLLVQSSIDGYNVCIFAYGQTGSGKTFTMEGSENITDFSAPENESHLGMIPRSVQQIFQSIQNLEARGWTYKTESFFLEVYNDCILDLLHSNPLSENNKCEIKQSGAKGNDCQLSNVTASPVTCAEEVFSLLKIARANRAVAATKSNEHSSRSHYIFQLKIVGENSLTGEKCNGTLNLVDLAGSERIKKSESKGERRTEAIAINQSLSTLGKVIKSLSNKEKHVPYRDSKLTHLLANCLGGNSKTLMFVNLSPIESNISESVQALRFATQVNECNIGTAQKSKTKA